MFIKLFMTIMYFPFCFLTLNLSFTRSFNHLYQTTEIYLDINKILE